MRAPEFENCDSYIEVPTYNKRIEIQKLDPKL